MKSALANKQLNRRDVLISGAAGIVTLVMPLRLLAARPRLDEVIRTFTGGATVSEGRVKFDIAALVENGNAVPVSVEVESPMTAEQYVRRIALFNEKNPQPDVGIFHFSPRSGRAAVSTRIRLATSQVVVAVAELSDGTFWSSRANVVVTIAACIEDLSIA